MPISSTVRKAGPYVGTGATRALPFTFKAFGAADLRVVWSDTSTGVETDLALGVDYTVTLNSNQDASPGGTVTPTAAWSSVQRITITTDIDALQPVDLTNQGGFYPTVINTALDRLTMLIQQVLEEMGRTLRVAISDDAGGVDLPPAANRANRVLAFDSAGAPQLIVGVDSSSAAALQLQLASQVSPTGGAGMLGYRPSLAYAFGTVGARLRHEVLATDVGVDAKGDCVLDPATNAVTTAGTDDTAALQAGLDLAGSRTSPPTFFYGMHGQKANRAQGVFRLAPGRTYRITAALKVPPGVRFDLNGSIIYQATAGEDGVQVLSQGLGWTFYGSFLGKISNGVIIGVGAGTSTGRGLFLELANSGAFDNLTVQGFKYGITEWETQYCHFTRVRTFNNAVGRYRTARPTNTSLATVDNRDDDCSSVGNTIYGQWDQCVSACRSDRLDLSRNGVCDLVIGEALKGQLRTFTIVSGGSGYAANATIPCTVTGGGGSYAQVYAETNGAGVVTAVRSSDAGWNYTSAPTITVPGGSVAAVVTCTPTTDAVGDWSGVSSTARGGNQYDLKIEHTAADRPTSGYQVYITDNLMRQNRIAGFNPQRQGSGNQAYHRWLFNAGIGTSITDPQNSSDAPSAQVNPAVSGDCSVVRSVSYQGVVIEWPTGIDNTKVPLYAVDGTGAPVYAGYVAHVGVDGDGRHMGNGFRACVGFGGQAVVLANIPGEAYDRLQLTTDGQILLGTGAAPPQARLRLNTAGSRGNGDVNVTLTAGTDKQTQRWVTTLTADRTVTLATSGAVEGDAFSIVRPAAGAFTLTVAGKALAANTWADVEFDGAAWFLKRYGSL